MNTTHRKHPIFYFFLGILLSVNFISQSQELKDSEVDVSEFVSGTLLEPTMQTNKLAIIVAGSGPTDRDGNSQMTRNNSLKLLAEGLTEKGIATYRYDKRVVTMMKKRTGRISEVLFDDVITDAKSVISHFTTNSDYDEIYLIGHSQGSLVSILAAQEEPVKGLISLAGPSQTIDASIIQQVSAQMPNFEEELRSNFETLKTTGSLQKYNPLLASIFNKEVQDYLLNWMEYDPSVEIQKLSIPVSVINGTKDFQVNEVEAERLLEAKPDASMTIIQDMNHVLRIIETDDLLVNQKSYQEPNTPISEELINTIVSFIKQN